MPSKTEKQRRFMAMCSTPKGRTKAKGKCPPQKVAMEFRHADRGSRAHHVQFMTPMNRARKTSAFFVT